MGDAEWAGRTVVAHRILRVYPHWPKDRYIELAPKYWKATRARLDPLQLDAELGPLTVPSS